MSSLFQGLVQASGAVNTVVSDTAPVGSTFFRGILIDSAGAVVIKTDTGQARSFIGGLAVESSTGILLTGGSVTPFAIAPGGILADRNGSVALKIGDPQVIHQGVGLQNNGTLTVTNMPP